MDTNATIEFILAYTARFKKFFTDLYLFNIKFKLFKMYSVDVDSFLCSEIGLPFVYKINLFARIILGPFLQSLE